MTVKAAWPAANEIAAGAKPANRTANGNRNQNRVVFVPIRATRPAPTANPTTLPSRARTTF